MRKVWLRLADDVYENTCLGFLLGALLACASRDWGLGLFLGSIAAYLGLLGGFAAFMAAGLWVSGGGDGGDGDGGAT